MNDLDEETALVIAGTQEIEERDARPDHYGKPCDRCGEELGLSDTNHDTWRKVTDPTCRQCRRIEETLLRVTVSPRREPSKHDWGTRGFKKFDDVPIRGKHRTDSVRVFFKKQDGSFAAYYLNMYFETKDYKALEVALEEQLKQAEAITFSRYLIIRYERRGESERGRGSGSFSWGGRREGEDFVPSGISLEYDVYDVSAPFDTCDASGTKGRTYKSQVQRRMWRTGGFANVEHGEWRVEDEETTSCQYGFKTDGSDNSVIPYTEERRATLDAIRDAIRKIDERLNAILGDGAKDTALLLDGLDGTRLLGPGKRE